ncbi:hypothetical protein E2P81_ATG05261 [Venturia nashicola]|uniref:C2 domain-containing protein n=1 Tax=Venturia nashicola TaxID=86259 RepID=A0A4Z1NX85_9PEZI|nr:hypothetical protein E6O75_ATG05391 [Venturia nashicola]TLD32285.1 hypothetical protein E2P81_ATG05261 [Venturia nashicola]
MVGSKITKLATVNHTAGIFSDMTVDGPEIGTLVCIVDRAKNLPNRRSMGKQDPYCACRLGKEAKKTKTDKRGGQVPRWDQELRFTVHDSPDYYNLKVSVFNDDKKTELIGETWVRLEDVIVAGGGQSDIWHNLNCKGKYAGELRLELTYYDSRPKPERPVAEAPRETSSSSAVKRRPLPNNPSSNTNSPHERLAASGPRELGTPPRSIQPVARSSGNTPSSQRRTVQNNQQPQPAELRKPVASERFYPETPDDPFIQQSALQQQHQELYHDQRQNSAYNAPPNELPYSEPSYREDPNLGLPELPPMNNNRRPPPQPSYAPTSYDQTSQHSPYEPQPQRPAPAPYQPQTQQPPPELHHAHSAPPVPAQSYDISPLRQSLQHTQSDSYMHHGQSMQASYEEVPEPAYDPYSGQEPLFSSPPQQQFIQQTPHQQSPAYNCLDEFDRPNGYSPPKSAAVEQYSQPPPPAVHELPPPPPAHRDSTSNAVARHRPSRSRQGSGSQEYQPEYVPAPLNIASAREAQNQMMYQEPQDDEYSSAYGTPVSDRHGRRNTDPTWSSPTDVQPYRPRASSGDAVRRRPVSRSDDPYTLPPSHPDYHSPTTSSPPVRYPHERRHSNTRQPKAYSPVPERPLAIESQSQPITPTRATRYYQPQPVVAKAVYTPPRSLYSNPHHAVSEPYLPPVNYQTPPTQHPLSREVPVGPDSSPNPYGGGVGATPPRAPSNTASPAVLYSANRQTRPQNRSTPTLRKSVSPQPLQAQRPRSTMFGPDDFDQFNPAARSTSSLVNNPATSAPGTPNVGMSSQQPSPYEGGKIIDFHGKEIDPSDRLPEASWAPEPESRGASKEKPVRDRIGLTGARGQSPRDSFSGSASSRFRGGSASGSPMAYGSPASTSRESPSTTTIVSKSGNPMIRARLKRKERPHSVADVPSMPQQGVNQPFRDIPKPPAASSLGGYGAGSPSFGSSNALTRHRGSFSNEYENHNSFGGSSGYAGSPAGLAGYTGRGTGGPPIPAKVPIQNEASYGANGGSAYGRNVYDAPKGGMDALSREMSSIDIGSSGRGRVPRSRMLGYNPEK